VSDTRLFAEGQQAIRSIVDLALSCPAGGDHRWDQRLTELRVTGLSSDERGRHLREGPGQSRGALLLELRRALDAITEPIAERMDDRWRLRDAVEQAVRDYVNTVKPRITTSSIFANALAGAATSPGRVDGTAAATADCCRCCGAPLADRSATSCRYCGETL
jgi:hypothetical protein